MTFAGRAFSWWAPADRLTILIFHRVLPARDELWPEEWTALEFERVCQWMSEWFQVIPLDEAAERLASGRLPPRAACITFDDGYADNQTVACPILLRHGLCATPPRATRTCSILPPFICRPAATETSANA